MVIGKFHKLTAILLAAVLLVSSPLGVLALSVDAPPCGCGYAPTIFVTGIASIDIWKNLGTEQEEVMFPPSAEKITSALGSAGTVSNLAKFAVTGDWDKAADALIPAALTVLEDFGCNPDGTVKAGTGIKWSYPGNPAHSPGHDTGFYYDWREDPIEVARQLKDFIEYVCGVTGHDKVNLIAYSMGSIATMCYIQQFGYGRIAGLVLSAAALNGVSVAGEPFSGNITIDATGVIRYIDSLMSDDGQGALIKALAKVLGKAGVAGAGVDLVNYVIENLRDRVYSEVLTPLFGTSPGMWSLIPDEYYEPAKRVLLSDTEKYSGLIEKIDYYHYQVQAHNEEFIDGAIERGINFGVVLKYGLQGFPCGNSGNNSTDTVIDAKYASFGATIAELDKTLGSNYVQAVGCGHNHISADNQIDASTCKYPETTWFVKDFIHMHTSGKYDALLNYIFFSQEHVTVFDNPQYPQFLMMDEKTDTLSPLQPETPDELTQLFGADSWAVLLLNLFQEIFVYVRRMLAAMAAPV